MNNGLSRTRSLALVVATLLVGAIVLVTGGASYAAARGAGGAQAHAAGTSTITDAAGDVPNPAADITDARADYTAGTITMSAKVANVTNPMSDSNWAGDNGAAVVWGISLNNAATPNFMLVFGAPTGTLFAAVLDPAGNQLCAATPTFSPTDGYAASFPATCIGSPAQFTYDAYVNYAGVSDFAPDDGFAGPVVNSVPGFWLVGQDGGVFSFGQVGFHGSTGAMHLNRPIVGLAAKNDNSGYWFVASDGGVFAFDAPFFGSAGGTHLNQPIVGMAATPDGGGYWLVARDGGIFSYGDAAYFGSTGNIHLNQPIVAMAPTPSGQGYWFVAADGGIFNYGDAGFFGSGAGKSTSLVVGMAATPDGKGYWLATSDGGVESFGDAAMKGSAARMPTTEA